MTLRTNLVTGTVGLILSVTIAGIPALAGHRDHGDGSGRHWLPRVSAEGAAPSQYAARMQAVHRWRDKVANRYGYEFSRWWTARDKDVNCKRVADDDPSWDTYGRRGAKREHRSHHYEPVTRCTVSAVPSRGGHYGWLSR